MSIESWINENIRVDTTWMKHEGGTKFYETTTIANITNHKAIVMNRWGTISAARSGGSTRINAVADDRHAANYKRKVVDNKAERGYVVSVPNGAQKAFEFIKERGVIPMIDDHPSLKEVFAGMLDSGDWLSESSTSKPESSITAAEKRVNNPSWGSW